MFLVSCHSDLPTCAGKGPPLPRNQSSNELSVPTNTSSHQQNTQLQDLSAAYIPHPTLNEGKGYEMLFWTCPTMCTDTVPGPRRCQQRADLLFICTDMDRTRATNILIKQNPFGKISDLAALACQQPKKCRQDIALVPILAGTSVGMYLTSPCWFPLHGHKLSHPVNTQLDMKTSTHFVYIFTLPFTASASTMVIQTL